MRPEQAAPPGHLLRADVASPVTESVRQSGAGAELQLPVPALRP